jgi:hypothetical protein
VIRSVRSIIAYDNLVRWYVLLNRFDDAKSTAQEAQEHKLDGPSVHLTLYQVDFLQHNGAGMEREVAGLMGKPGYEDTALGAESDTAAYRGEFAKARELTHRAIDSAQRADQKEAAAGYEVGAAMREALVGNMAFAKQSAQVG